MDYETVVNRDQPTSNDSIIATANNVSHNKGQHQKGNFNNYSQSSQYVEDKVVCQYCNKPGHVARNCFKIKGYPKRNGHKPVA
ncbi:hypothetical protein A2U01_0075372, partial [Trifolium medium]|nr:hypothetical protein [Trifolium medium]